MERVDEFTESAKKLRAARTLPSRICTTSDLAQDAKARSETARRAFRDQIHVICSWYAAALAACI